jgi:hypothetical protein
LLGKSRRIILVGHVKEKTQKACQTFFGTKRGRCAVLIDLKDTGCDDMDENERALERAQ